MLNLALDSGVLPSEFDPLDFSVLLLQPRIGQPGEKMLARTIAFQDQWKPEAGRLYLKFIKKPQAQTATPSTVKPVQSVPPAADVLHPPAPNQPEQPSKRKVSGGIRTEIRSHIVNHKLFFRI
jgi:hypothetical protein